MKNIETAIEAIESEKQLELEKVNEFDDLIARLKRIQDGNFTHLDSSENVPLAPSQTQNLMGDKERFKDYPYEQKLSKKLQYLDSVLNRPFRAVNRLELIEKLEGAERRAEFKDQISQQLNYMVSNMTYIGQKYGANSKTFYYRREWADFDGRVYTIKPEYEITPAEFEAAEIPEYKRKEFEWIVSKAVKTMSEINNSPQ